MLAATCLLFVPGSRPERYARAQVAQGGVVKRFRAVLSRKGKASNA
jgi:hypothetical protein